MSEKSVSYKDMSADEVAEKILAAVAKEMPMIDLHSLHHGLHRAKSICLNRTMKAEKICDHPELYPEKPSSAE